MVNVMGSKRRTGASVFSRFGRSLKSSRPAMLSFAMIALLSMSVLIYLPQRASAIGQLYLSPSSSSVQNGNNVIVSIRVDPGTSIDGVETKITYDQSKLQYVSTSDSGSAFTFATLTSGGNGTVDVWRGIFGAVTDDSLVARVTFKALAGSGSTTLNLSGYSTWGGNSLGTTTGSSTVTFTSAAPAPTPTPTPTPSPTPAPTPSPSPSTTPTPSTSGGGTNTNSAPSPPSAPTPKDTPGAVNISVGSIETEFTKAKLTLNLSEEAKVSIRFGTTPDNLSIQTAQTGLGKNQEISLDEKLLFPGTTFYYQVIAENSAGVETISEVQSFKTKGYTVRISLQDKNSNPLINKTVTLYSDPVTAKTDEEGIAEFTDVAPGQHRIEYEQDGKVYSQDLLIEDNVQQDVLGVQTASVQNIAIVYNELTQTTTMAISTTIGIVASLALIAGTLYLLSRRYSPALVFANIKSKISSKEKGTSATNGVATQEVPSSINPTPSAINTPPASTTPQSTTIQPGTTSTTSNDTPLIFKVEGAKHHNPGSVINPTTGPSDENGDENNV